jgi:hypothetical protein
VIVAASVTAGLVAMLLQSPLLDTLVGLAVALLILKSAIELAIKVVRSLGEESGDLSRFGIGLGYERFRQAQLRDWMLYLVNNRGVETRGELIAQARYALDFQRIPAVEALGLVQSSPRASEMIRTSLSDLFERGWLIGEDQLRVTEAGKTHLGSTGNLPNQGTGTHR